MKRLPVLALVLFSACRATGPETPAALIEGPITELRRSFTCPLPPSRGLITIARDGKIERVIFDGFGFELGKTKTSREQMTLAPEDAARLFRFVEDAGWRTMPEQPDPTVRATCADCCAGALFVKTTEGGRSLSYADRVPPRLQALLKEIDDTLGRGTWTRIVHPWEPQR